MQIKSVRDCPMFSSVRKYCGQMLNSRSLVADCAVLVILAGIFGSLYWEVLDMHVWRFDALILWKDYMGKLQSEGRWVNWILFPGLKRLQPQVSIALCLMFWAYFSYAVAKRYTDDKRLSAIFAMLAMQIPSFYWIVGWPSCVMPAFAMLAVFAFYADRLGAFPVFFLSGILFFGSYNNFYNLILLLYLKEIVRADWRRLLRLFLIWGLCYIIGFAFMLLATKLIGGHWGLVISPYRPSHSIEQLSDLIFNLKRVWTSFNENCAIIGKWHILLLVCLCLCFSLYDALFRKKAGACSFFALIGVAAVAFACYAQSVPYGLVVMIRTAFGLYMAVFVLTLMLCIRVRTIGLVFVLLIGMSCYFRNFDCIHYYTNVSNTWRNSFLSMNVSPASTKIVHICSDARQIAEAEKKLVHNLVLHKPPQIGFSGTKYQYPILRSAGFQYYDTNVELCSKYANQQLMENDIHRWLVVGDELFVWLK